jgi:hypothetical protein
MRTADLHSLGLDVLGAAMPFATRSATNRAVLIRVKNMSQVVAAQGGKMGSLFYASMPDTIEAEAYKKMADQVAAGMKEKGVDAEVMVVEPSGFTSAASNPIWEKLAIGLMLVDVVALGWKGWKWSRK